MDALQSGVPRDVNLGAVQNDDGRPDRSAFDFLELPGGFSDVALDESHAVYAGRVARGALRVCAREGQTGMGEEGLVARRSQKRRPHQVVMQPPRCGGKRSEGQAGHR